jgi:hypothetical protein
MQVAVLELFGEDHGGGGCQGDSEVVFAFGCVLSIIYKKW